MTTPRHDRADEIHRRLVDFETAAGERHPHHADAVRLALGHLRARLQRVHQTSAAADDRAWADYVADLDRGLDALHLDIGRAAEQPEKGPGVEEVLLMHTSALELTGWRMRFALPDAAAGEVRSRIDAAEEELSRYRAACAGESTAPAEPLVRSMDDVRRLAGS